MALMMARLYEALVAAKVPDDKAREAAIEAAEARNDVADLKSTQRLHTWMLTFNTAMLVLIVSRLFLSH
jgi:hypothetical protein